MDNNSLSAIDPSIRCSFAVAGSIPLYLRTGGSVGDKQKYLEEFYKLAGATPIYTCWARMVPAASRFRLSTVVTIAASARRNITLLGQA